MRYILLAFAVAVLFSGCKKDEDVADADAIELPTVVTSVAAPAAVAAPVAVRVRSGLE